MSSPSTITVEVSYALPQKQQIVALDVAADCTVYGAAQLSGIERQFAELDLSTAKMGIFGKVVAKPKEQVLMAGDRVEIYRPLIADPKEARKERAAKVKAAKVNAS